MVVFADGRQCLPLQVWLAAAEQQAAAAVGDAAAGGPADGRGASLTATLAMANPLELEEEPPASSAAVSAADAGVDLAALLLDARNAPLRRIAMDANPAKTIAGMPSDMKRQLKEVSSRLTLCSGRLNWLLEGFPLFLKNCFAKLQEWHTGKNSLLRCRAVLIPGHGVSQAQILVEVLGSGSAASRLTAPSAAARAQRKRLFLLFRWAPKSATHALFWEWTWADQSR
jgi:hypothetical protein